MTSVKELENQLKVSKVSIYTMLKKPVYKPHVYKGAKDVAYVDDIGVELLKAHYFKEQGETLKDIADETIDHNKASGNEASKDMDDLKNTDIISLLQEQLDKKDEQINSLLSIVLNQQKLQATQLLTGSKTIVNGDNPMEKPPKEGFFRKLFSKIHSSDSL